MPQKIYEDGFLTIWSFKNDVVLQDHFNKCGFNKLFKFKYEIKDAIKVEKMNNKPMGIMYKFKSIEQLKAETLGALSMRLHCSQAMPGDVQAELCV